MGYERGQLPVNRYLQYHQRWLVKQVNGDGMDAMPLVEELQFSQAKAHITVDYLLDAEGIGL